MLTNLTFDPAQVFLAMSKVCDRVGMLKIHFPFGGILAIDKIQKVSKIDRGYEKVVGQFWKLKEVNREVIQSELKRTKTYVIGYFVGLS